MKGPYKRSNLKRKFAMAAIPKSETFGRPLTLKFEQAMIALREWQNNGCHSKKALNVPCQSLSFYIKFCFIRQIRETNS